MLTKSRTTANQLMKCGEDKWSLLRIEWVGGGFETAIQKSNCSESVLVYAQLSGHNNNTVKLEFNEI